jgi:hypothetical protein
MSICNFWGSIPCGHDIYCCTIKPPNECPISTGGKETSFLIKSAISPVCVYCKSITYWVHSIGTAKLSNSILDWRNKLLYKKVWPDLKHISLGVTLLGNSFVTYMWFFFFANYVDISKKICSCDEFTVFNR